MPMKNPPHPGDFIRTGIIQAAGLSATEAAKALQVCRPALSSLLNGKADLSGDMALRIEKACSSPGPLLLVAALQVVANAQHQF